MLIPRPVHYQEQEGWFVLTKVCSLFSASSREGGEAWLRREIGEAAGVPLPSVSELDDLQIRLLHREGLLPEAYELKVTPLYVEIGASEERGWYWGIQSLKQLLPEAIYQSRPGEGPWTIPCCEIFDQPRFQWRGLMLDTARHYFPVSDIKRFLDHMAVHKLNVFHWHLVDDQGWRLQIQKYPRLTEVGALRAESPRAGKRNEGDGVPYAGFYTQEDVRDIVRYAADRQITIVPEIEMPGHAGAMIAAYPELGNYDVPDYQPEVRTRWGVNPCILAPTEEVFSFLENVFAEVMDLFPGKYIHIGGDEAPKDHWKQSARAQAIREEARLTDEEQMQHWFLARIEKFLHANGRRLIGWDEISEGGLSSTAAMMLWRDWKWARRALDAGNSVVMSPASHCYLDYSQGSVETEPEAICGELTLQTTYSFEPVPENMSSDTEERILGIQGNVWTEYIRDRGHLDYMTWPRAAALAEIAWSPRQGRRWEDFANRLDFHSGRLQQLGIGFRPLDFVSPEQISNV